MYPKYMKLLSIVKTTLTTTKMNKMLSRYSHQKDIQTS